MCVYRIRKINVWTIRHKEDFNMCVYDQKKVTITSPLLSPPTIYNNNNSSNETCVFEWKARTYNALIALS